jgi:uncharacterized BrkB/YihY/UPF0761 family membrane protein
MAQIIRIDRGARHAFWRTERHRFHRETLLVLSFVFGILFVFSVITLILG